MKTMSLALLGVAALLLAGESMGACTWKSIADGDLSAAATWEIESGTPALGQTVPAAGDSIHVLGHSVFMDSNTDFETVTLGASGKIIGSQNSMTAPVDVVHNWKNLVLDTGNVTLTEGRKPGFVTYNIDSMTGNGDGNFTCAYFAANTAEEQTIPVVNFKGDVNWVTSQGFPFYPLNFNGTFYNLTKLVFSGDNASVSLPTPGNIDVNMVTVEAGKTVTFKSGKFNMSMGLVSQEFGNFEIDGTALFETPAFVWSYAGTGAIKVNAGGVIGTNFSGGIASTDSASWGNGSVVGSTIEFDPAGGVMYFGSENQVTGDLLPAAVGNLVLDKTGGVLTLSADLFSEAMSLLNGTLSTEGSYTLTGPRDGKLIRTNGQVTGPNWTPFAGVSDWSLM